MGSATFSYPGVYIEELSGGQQTITGVATSIAVFIGWAPQGPVTGPILVESFAEYQTTFGGLNAQSFLGYAVNQFFNNGGAQAYILRLIANADSGFPAAVTASASIGGLQWFAVSPGSAGNATSVAVTAPDGTGNFDVTVSQTVNGTTSVVETYTGVDLVAADPNYVATQIDGVSKYITLVDPANPAGPIVLPGSTTLETKLLANGTDAVASTAQVSVGGLTLYASSPGAWANNSISVVTTAGSGGAFSLSVLQTANGSTQVLESYNNLSLSPTSAQYLVTVLNNDSKYVTFINPASPSTAPTLPATVPTATAVFMGGGLDGPLLDPTASDGTFTSTLFPSGATPASPGYMLLEQVQIFNLLCVPGYSDAANLETLQQYCSGRRAFLIVDPPQTMTHDILQKQGEPLGAGNVAFSGSFQSNAAYYFPWISVPDPLYGGRPKLCPPCGAVAGIYAATDADRGVWKAPAGLSASIGGVLGLQYTLSDAQNGDLNPLAINCLRQFPIYGDVVWGARTMAGADLAGSQWKYIPVRRLALYIESSLYYGTQWAVFEPNDEPLWGQLRMSVGTFMQGLFQAGAFSGDSAQKAYFVKCDAENNPPSRVALGIVTVTVGFAPLDPAEFVVIQITQIVNS